MAPTPTGLVAAPVVGGRIVRGATDDEPMSAVEAVVMAPSYREGVIQEALDFYRTPSAMTALPDHPGLGHMPSDLDALRRVVQGLLLHRDWAAAYGIEGDAMRMDEENLRATADVVTRALELSGEPITVPRQPIDRVLCICRHFTLVHTALLRAQGVPARVRCGFSSYFDPTKWYDHWITERWNGERWVRDDPQIDDLQAKTVNLDFDPHDQPPGRFLTGSEAWIAARAGEVDANLFGIFDMWGSGLHLQQRHQRFRLPQQRRAAPVGRLGDDDRATRAGHR